MVNDNINSKKLQWKVKHTKDFSKEIDFLETLLIENGVNEEDIPRFLAPKKKEIHSPFLMDNMEEAVELVHNSLKNAKKNKRKIMVKVDPDVDGYTSSSAIIQFLNAVAQDVEIEYELNFEKVHGLTLEDVIAKKKDEYELIIIPDASMTCENARQIKRIFDVQILVLDHHLVENEFLDKETNEWINRDEAKVIYKTDKNRIEVDCYTNYCLAVNCHDGKYPNPNLSGVGVVQKFIEAYMDKYEEEDNIDEKYREYFLDLVSLGINKLC